VDDVVRHRLHLADRALRPKAAALRTLAHETAVGNDLQRALLAEAATTNDLLRTQIEELRGLNDLTARLLASTSPAEADNAMYDQWTLNIINAVLVDDGGIGIDVGAHHGDILQAMVSAAPGSRHHAFEPIPAMAEDLEARFPSVEVHQVALAAEAGSAQFHHVTSNPAYSGILRRRFDRPHEDVEVIDVKLGRLDDFVDPGLPVRLIKIDVEGAELGVLQGAEKVLEQQRPVVVFEHGLGASDVYGTTPAMIHQLFASHGMQVSLLDRWLAGAPPLTYDEFEGQYYSARNYYFVAYDPDRVPRPTRP
jgi:FkbM family methyltransferase